MLFSQIAQQGTDESGLPWYAYLFWAWVLAAIGIWVYRLFRRVTNGSTQPPVAAAGAKPRTQVPPPAGSVGAAGSPERLTPTPTIDPSSDSRPRESPATEGPSAPGPRRSPGPPDRSTSGTPTPDSGGRSGLFAPNATPSPSSDAARTPVAHLLQGISMPCDLAPIISDSMAVRASAGLFVAFSTNTVSAPEVGSALGDELEQLGFAVESVSDSAVEARRSDGNLRVSLVTEPGELKREGIKVYPTLPPASIVVEFESI